MKETILGYTFVGLWEKALTLGLPVLDNKFCLDLFGDPYTTKTLLTPEGFLISKAAPIGISPPSVLLSNVKFQVSNPNLSDLVKVLYKLTDEMIRIDNKIDFSFSEYGLNFEFEIKGFGKPTFDWMGEKYLSPDLKANQGSIIAKDISFETKYPDGKIFSIQVQPRFNDVNAMFILVNSHQTKKLSITSKINLSKEFETAEADIKSRVFKILSI